MPDRTHKGGHGDASGLSSGRERPAEATFGISEATPSGKPDSSGAAPSGRSGGSGVVEPEGIDPDMVTGPEDAAASGDPLEAALAAAAEWRDKGMRVQAEYENARKRLELRHADMLLRAAERVVAELFPVMDDLERAIDHATGEGAEVAEGLAAVHRKLTEVIAREGCSVIDPLGQPFDPERHSAVQMREDDGVPDHTVVEVFQKGYEMHGRVLRPAMVVVSTGGPSRGE